jgi:hypothetical protein
MKITLNCRSVSPFSEICWNCLHFNSDNPTERKCKAFPEDIPLEIWECRRNHDEAYPNDNNIRFKHFKSESITSQDIIDEIKERYLKSL